MPSVEQLRAIVANIRSQKFADTREEVADFVEAEGTLGLGKAEIAQLSGHDIDLKKNIVRVRRQKTEKPFTIPLYPQAKPVIERRLRIAGERKVDRLFSIADPKVAVTNACRRLNFPKFTQRSFRKMFVTEGLRSRVPVKVMADLQGHKDGGKLPPRVRSSTGVSSHCVITESTCPSAIRRLRLFINAPCGTVLK